MFVLFCPYSLEEAGHPVHILNLQYRMHPAISAFPRRIFYEGVLQDGPNVTHKNFGNPLRSTILSNFPAIKVRKNPSL